MVRQKCLMNVPLTICLLLPVLIVLPLPRHNLPSRVDVDIVSSVLHSIFFGIFLWWKLSISLCMEQTCFSSYYVRFSREGP